MAISLFAPRAVLADPHTDYILNCQGCHGPDGSGAPGAVPSFRGHLAKFLRVPEGREYLLRVPGSSQSELSDARIAALMNWMFVEFSREQIPAEFQPYTAEEVTRLRRPPLTDVIGVRQRLIEKIDASQP